MVDIPLGLGNIRQLERDIKRLQRTLKSKDFNQAILDDVGEELYDIVKDNITSARLDGNYQGSDPIDLWYTHTLGDQVRWRGDQIAYVEFGTGAAGAGRYPKPELMGTKYRPDSNKLMWWYKDARTGPTLSYGLAPQAPMYKSSVEMRMLLKGKRSRVHIRVKKLVENALTAR